VEFAVDNVQTLKLRKAKIQAQQHATRDGQTNVRRQSNETPTRDAHPDNKKSEKRKSRGDDRSVKDSVSNKVEGRATKKQKINLASGKAKEFSSKEKPVGSQWKSKNHQDGKKPDSGVSPKGNMAVSVAQTLKSSTEADVHPRKRKLHNQKEERDLKRRNKAKKSEGAVDKLDMLIEQYRSKFSRQSSEKTGGEKQGSRQLRRWFQS
jgi:nucleolar protein 4